VPFSSNAENSPGGSKPVKRLKKGKARQPVAAPVIIG